MAKTKTARQFDFRGGYQSNLPPDLTPPNVLKTATNIYWYGQITKRPGWDNLSTSYQPNDPVGMSPRVKLNGTWYTIIADDSGTVVKFYYGNTAGYTEITDGDSAAFTWTTAKNVEMREFGNKIIAVNGTDKPVVIYYDGSKISVQRLEEYDERVRGDDEWYAGLWDDGASPEFVDDTTDAQDEGSDDWKIATGGTNNDGFYIAGVSPFTKIVISSVSQFDGSPVAEYAYYAGEGGWTTVTPTSAPTWTAAAGDRTVEFDLPFDTDGTLLWQAYGDVDAQIDPTGVPGGALNRYIFRVRFTTAPTSDQTADSAVVSHTQYLSQIFLNEAPQAIAVHKERLFLAAGNAFRYSPPNQIKNWNSRDIEYCEDGGVEIRMMVSANAYLAILKDAYIYRYFGTTTNNFVLRSYPQEGVTSKRGAAYVGNVVVYTADDGIRVLAGEDSVLASRHIQSDYDGWTKSNTVVANYNGDAVISFPTSSIILWADTDTAREDQVNAGDAAMSFWKWTGQNAEEIWYSEGAADTEQLILLDATNTRLVKSTADAFDTAYDTTETNISCTLETSYMSTATPNQKKRYRRVKIDMSKSGDWTFTISGDNGDATATATIESGTGTSHYYADISIPYTLDGQNISYKLVNQTANDVEVFGFSTAFEGRAF